MTKQPSKDDISAQGESMTRVAVFEVIVRPGYELVTAAGDDRPAYVGSRVWNERQKNLNVHKEPRS